MLLRQQEEARLVDSCIPCLFLGCPRYFRTNGGLTKHQRSFHLNWDPKDEEGQSLDSEHLRSALIASLRPILMLTLDHLQNLYTTYSDNLESKDHESAAAYSYGNEGSEGSHTSNPSWDTGQSDDAWQASESEITNTLDSSSDVSEQRTVHCSDLTINLDFPQPPSVVATGDGTPNAFTLKNPNSHYQAHQTINGEILLIPNISVANFIDQEHLVATTVAI